MENAEPTSGADTARALRQIVEAPIESWQSAELLRGRLADREVPTADVNLLVTALREGVPQRILRERDDTPREVLAGILRNRLIDGQGMAPERASWAVTTWLDALRPQSATTADDLVWGPDATTVRAAGADAKPVPRPDPKPVPKPVRPSWMFPAIAVASAALAVFALTRWLDSREAAVPEVDYDVIALDVFRSDVENVGLNELLNYVSTCMAGATFGTERCRATWPVSQEIPFLGVDQSIAYTTVPLKTISVAVKCTLTDPAGVSADTRDWVAELPDSGFGEPRRSSTRWRAMFARPDSGWVPGRYRVTCTSPRHSIDGFFLAVR